MKNMNVQRISLKSICFIYLCIHDMKHFYTNVYKEDETTTPCCYFIDINVFLQVFFSLLLLNYYLLNELEMYLQN